MSSPAAPRCQHIKVSGTQCGSPALRAKRLCFYHQQNRPLTVECYSEGEYSTGEIELPAFEDAHSIQTVIRQVFQLLLQKRIERKTASLLLYALQIASSNLKRLEQEKPRPAEVVTDVDSPNLEMPSPETQANQQEVSNVTNPTANQTTRDKKPGGKPNSSATVTIQACYRPKPKMPDSQIHPPQKQYVI